MSALDDAQRLLGYEPPTHLSGPEWRRLVERLVLELIEARSTVERLEQTFDVRGR